MRSGCRECQRTLPAISSRMLRFTGSWCGRARALGWWGAWLKVPEMERTNRRSGSGFLVAIFRRSALSAVLDFFESGWL